MVRPVEQDIPFERLRTDETDRWIEQALHALQGVALVTPVKRLKWLEPLVGVPVFAKLEFQQVSGSFKFRGALNALSHRTRPDTIAASAGNHGLAVATAARIMGLCARIVLPVGASRLKRSKLEFEGAQVLEHGDSLEAARVHARQLAEKHDWDYVSPFADRRVVAGGATALVEALDQCPDDLAEVVVPVGGGGLLAGAVWARRRAAGGFGLLGAEPENYASVLTSLNAGRPQCVVNQPTFADGLAVQLGGDESTLPWLMQQGVSLLTCTEEEIASATVSLLQNESWLVEPSGAISVAALVKRTQHKPLGGPALVLLTGGNLQKSTLHRLLTFPFTQQTPLARLLGLTGERPSERSRPRLFSFSSDHLRDAPAPAADVQVHLKVARRDWVEHHAAAQRLLGEYRAYCDSRHLPLSPPLLDAAERLLDIASPARALRPMDDEAGGFAAKAHLRGMNILCSTVTRLFNWRSPAYDQCLVPQFLELRSQDNADVNYERYGSAAVTRIEGQLRDVFGVGHENVACTVTSSGMAAYSLIESHLLRHVVPHKMRVAIAPYVYFETVQQIESLPMLEVERLPSYDADEVAEVVLAGGHDVVFIDPLANNVEMRVCDVARLARTLARRLTRRLYLVVDGTMASAQLPSQLFCDENLASPHLEILYYESGSKYLQLGLEYTLAGVVVHRSELRPYMERLRRNTGTILGAPDAGLFPNYDAQDYRRHLDRIGANCAQLAHALAAMPKVNRYVVVHSPALPTHVDHAAAVALRFTGGCLCLQFLDDGLNAPDPLNALIALVLEEARAARVPIVKGVSFGFATSRISAAAAIADAERPFLRLYVGLLEPPGIGRLAAAVEAALVRFIDQTVDIVK